MYIINRTGVCSGCQISADDGFHHPGHTNAHETWSSKHCAHSVATDCYGKIQFPASKTKTANVIDIK